MNREVQWVDIDWNGRTTALEYQFVNDTGAEVTAPLMVFLHEGLGSLAMWRDFPTRLCTHLGCRGLVYSRPAYGRSSPRPAEEHWAPDFLHRQAKEVLPRLLTALGIDPRHTPLCLFGHSDGGSIALLYAACFPKAARGIIVLAPHIVVEDITLSSIQAAKEAYVTGDLRAGLARYHSDPDSAFWGWNDIWLHPDFCAWQIQDELVGITCPVLALQGREDQYGTLVQIEGIAQVVPQTRVVVFEACGHAIHKDQPARLIQEVSTFLPQIF